jgi:methylated-DNA-[protein]-cysteine S-methyltransferase
MESPVGPLTIAGNENGLHSISFGMGCPAAAPALRGREPGWDVVEETIRQLRAYFAGNLVQFDLPLKPDGTPFQMQVWRELQNISYGTVISYGELARRIGKPKASRAVGAANGANPIPIIIPCHRVIGSNGNITGYAGGVHIKEALLELERVRLL